VRWGEGDLNGFHFHIKKKDVWVVSSSTLSRSVRRKETLPKKKKEFFNVAKGNLGKKISYSGAFFQLGRSSLCTQKKKAG